MTSENNPKGKIEAREIVRLINVDVTGRKTTLYAIASITGVSYNLSNAICNILKIDKNKRIGELSEEEIGKIVEVIHNHKKYNIPSFLLNRRNDYDTGEDKHLLGGDIRFTKEMDIKREKKIKSYKGARHTAGLPVRGQRTKAHFRKNKRDKAGGHKKPRAAPPVKRTAKE